MTPEKIKVSIIIPVYKAEQYIEKCVRTLFGQTMKSLEFIFVNDCSPDDSIGIMLRVLEEYPQRRNQVKIIRHEVNRGVGRSRQDGINAASGEYIIHCDPDDWVEPDMYEKLYAKAKETYADIVICDYSDIFNGYTRDIPQRPLELSSESVLKSISGASPHCLHGSLWNKMISSSCYRCVRIPDRVDYCEDMLVLFQILKSDRKIEYIPGFFYKYNRTNESSITTSSHHKNLEGDRLFINSIASLSYEDQSSVNAIGEFMLWQAFDFADCSDSEFKDRYAHWEKFIGYRQGTKKILRMLMRMACRGHYARAKRIFKLMYNTKNKIKRVIISMW